MFAVEPEFRLGKIMHRVGKIMHRADITARFLQGKLASALATGAIKDRCHSYEPIFMKTVVGI